MTGIVEHSHVAADDKYTVSGEPDAQLDDGRRFFRGCLIAAAPSALLWWGIIKIIGFFW